MSPETARAAFVLELRNAHAMERQSQELMKWQAVRLADYPEIEQRIRAHMEETDEQLRRLERCLESLNERPSILKDTALSLLGNLTATSNAMGEDEILKNMFSNYAFEHYELATYKSLVRMAQELGLEEAKSLLGASRSEEQKMAAWIDRHIENVTDAYLDRIDQHLGIGTDLVWRAVGDALAVIEHDDPLGNRHDELHVVLDQQHRDAAVDDAPDRFVDLRRFARIEPGGRLVEHQDLGICRQRAGELEPLERAIGQSIGGMTDEIGKSHFRHQRRGALANLPGFAPDRRSAEQRGE